MKNGPELYEHAKTVIPGGTQLLSKRPEMFLPEHCQLIIARQRAAKYGI